MGQLLVLGVCMCVRNPCTRTCFVCTSSPCVYMFVCISGPYAHVYVVGGDTVLINLNQFTAINDYAPKACWVLTCFFLLFYTTLWSLTGFRKPGRVG